jgi:anti-sigma regulatory factor (Ser/Thr protein kinase)
MQCRRDKKSEDIIITWMTTQNQVQILMKDEGIRTNMGTMESKRRCLTLFRCLLKNITK